jgi:hypothetical protein
MELPIREAIYWGIGLFILGAAMEQLLKLPMATQTVMTCVQLIVAGILAGLGLKAVLARR